MSKFWVISVKTFPDRKVPVAARSDFEEARGLARTLALRYGKSLIEQGTEGVSWRFFPEDALLGTYGSLVNVDPLELDVTVPDWAFEFIEAGKD